VVTIRPPQKPGIRWTMTKEERNASLKRANPTVADPGGQQ